MSALKTRRAGLILGIAVLTAAPTYAAEVWPSDSQPAAPAQWSDGVAGRTLIAVDGSSASLTSNEGGLVLALTGPDGASRRLAFTFVGPQLGTIAADGDPAHVLGVFRQTDSGVEAQFSDGSRQSLVANVAGGLSLTVRAENGVSSCTSWYPGDHAFPAADRRAALAAYAQKLGLAKPGAKTAHASACVAAKRVARKSGEEAAATAKSSAHRAATDAPLMTISVRSSEVHPVDAVAAIPASVKIETPAPISAVAPAPPVMTTPVGRGASQCLNVESDGTNLGFRNQCDYSVEFAYCLQKTPDAATSCDADAKAGSVAPKAFASVVLDANIKSGDAEHNFRWVACSGGAGEIAAHLDHSEPPMGRCLRPTLAHS